MSPRPTKPLPSPATCESNPRGSFPLWGGSLAFVWVCLFLVLFFRFDLPNSGSEGKRVNRGDLWAILPQILLDDIDPPRPTLNSHVEPEELPRARERYQQQVKLWERSGWRYLPQRIPYIALGCFLLWSAWSLGGLSLSLLNIRDEQLKPGERSYLAFLIGVGDLSLLTLGGGLLGGLPFRGLAIAGLTLFALPQTWQTLRKLRTAARPRFQLRFLFAWLPLLPFASCFLLGALLPETDFDVKEYHLGGPKEWFLAGRIQFLPHNVYTSFPFLTEMLLLAGMVVTGDWYWGALTGKFVLMSFAPLTTWGLYLAGRRWCDARTGWIIALIYFTTPWIYRISIIAYAEGGLTAFLFAALFVCLLLCDSVTAAKGFALARRWALLCGWFAGCGMACKYPGLVSVVAPLGVAVAWLGLRSSDSAHKIRLTVGLCALFVLGTALAIGPWLLKNAVETGNPVYPLAYRWFGGREWSAEMDAKWKQAHSTAADQYRLTHLATNLIDVTLKSDWQSPLIFAFAPLAWLTIRRKETPQQRTLVVGLWLFLVYLFGTWWGLTHRIDRFWVPLLPVGAFLAGIGFNCCVHPLWRWGTGVVLAGVTLFHLGFITTPLCGDNSYLIDLTLARQETRRLTSPEITFLEERLGPSDKVLFVGEAELFDATFRYEYNTVFDECLLEQICTNSQGEWRPVEEIRQTLRQRGITYVCVNWQEILRYRVPTSYGYTRFAVPESFSKLRELGILADPMAGTGLQPLSALATNERDNLKEWGQGLIHNEPFSGSEIPVMTTFQVFPVRAP